MKKSISTSTAVKAAVGTGAAATAIIVPTVTLTGGSGENETKLDDLEKLGYKWKPITALPKAKEGHGKSTDKYLITSLLFVNQSNKALFRRTLAAFDDIVPYNTDSLLATNYVKKNYIKANDPIEALLFFEMGYPNNGNDVQGVARWELAINSGNQNVLITGFLNLGSKSSGTWRLSTFFDVLPPAEEGEPYTLNENKAIIVEIDKYKTGNQTFTIKNPTGNSDWSVTSKSICSNCSTADDSWNWTRYAGVWKPNSSSSEKLLDLVTEKTSNQFGLFNSSYSLDDSGRKTKYFYSQDRWREPAPTLANTDMKTFTEKVAEGLKDRKGSWISTTDYCNELKEKTKILPKEPNNPRKERRAQILRLCTEGPNR